MSNTHSENNVRRNVFQGFEDRAEGGKALAAELSDFRNREDVVILALPRGGVPVAYEVARELNLPLDVFLVRKLGVPDREELAFGAIASGGVTVFNRSILETFEIPDSRIKKVLEREISELLRQERRYRPDKLLMDLRDKTVIIVDDGIATGATMKAALGAIHLLGPKRVIVAVPVASSDACELITGNTGGSCICVMTPRPFNAVGLWYRDFGQTTDSEVCQFLSRLENPVGLSTLSAPH